MGFYSMHYNPVHLLLILFQLWLLGAPSVWITCPLKVPHCFLSTPLLSSTTRCSRLTLYFPCPASSGQRDGYPGVLGVSVREAILVQKNKVFERKNKIKNSSYILAIAGHSSFSPELWLEMEFSQNFLSALSAQFWNLVFLPVNNRKQRSGKKKTHDTHNHPLTPSFRGIIIQVLISVLNLPAAVSLSDSLQLS